jgi:hypothetical protein
LIQQGQPRPAAGGSTEKVCLYTIPARRQTQILTEEGQLTMTEEKVLDSIPTMQMTITPNELFRGIRAPTLQEGRRDHHQHAEGHICVYRVGEPGPAHQTDDTTVDNAAMDMDDDPLDEVNVGDNRTVEGESNHSLPDEEATTITPEEEPSTNPEGGSGNDRTVLATIRDETIELRARMMMLETNQSTLLTRLMELDTKPLLVGTTEPSEPAAANDGALNEKTIHEPCANAAVANMTNYEASKVARTGTDQPEVIREIIMRQNMKQPKAPIKMPKNQADKVQWIQPMTSESNEIKLSVHDKFYESTTLDQSHKYEQATMGIKPHISKAFIKDNFRYLTVVKSTHDSDNLPPNISTSQLESATKEEDADSRQGNKVIDDHDQKFDPPIDGDTTHPSIAVGGNHEPEVNIVKKAVEECCMVENLKGAEEHHWSLRYKEIASFMKEYMQLTNNKEPSPINKNYEGTVAGVDEKHPGDHDDQAT